MAITTVDVVTEYPAKDLVLQKRLRRRLRRALKREVRKEEKKRNNQKFECKIPQAAFLIR